MEMLGENKEGTVVAKYNNNTSDGFTKVPFSRHTCNNNRARITIILDNVLHTSNIYELLDQNVSSERITSLFPEDVDSVIRTQAREEIKRKEMEWEK